MRFHETSTRPRRRMRRFRASADTTSIFDTPRLKPLVRSAPRSAMFLPLALLVALLPGLYALGQSWDLDPPGPWWGLRALAVIDGRSIDQVPLVDEIGLPAEAWAYKTVALQPPLYAWLEAAGLSLSPRLDPIWTVLPSYLAGAAAVLLVYLHARSRRPAGTALLAAILVGLNHTVIGQMRLASPTTLGLASLTAYLFCYFYYFQYEPRSESAPAIIGGVCLGIAAASVGLIAVFVIPVVVLHAAIWNVHAVPCEKHKRGDIRCFWRNYPNFTFILISSILGFAAIAPWYMTMFRAHGSDFIEALLAPADSQSVPGERGPGIVLRLLELAPAIVPLGLLGAWRVVSKILTDFTEDAETSAGLFWLVWLLIACLIPAVLPTAPRSLIDSFILIPLGLLSASAIADLAARNLPVKGLMIVAPATAAAIAWSTSLDLRNGIYDLLAGRADYATALGLHLALDVLIASAFLANKLGRWARRGDGRRRLILACFLIAVIGGVIGKGLHEAHFRHRETRDLLDLRRIILRREQNDPFTLVAVVGPSKPISPFHNRSVPSSFAPGGRLRFILRATLPKLRQIDLTSIDQLLKLPPGKRLIIFLGADQRLSYPMQSRLNLEVIHPGISGILEAFATVEEPRKTIDR
jgi:hypothetical protein